MKTFRATFMERTGASGEPSERPTEYVANDLPDGVVRESNSWNEPNRRPCHLPLAVYCEHALEEDALEEDALEEDVLEEDVLEEDVLEEDVLEEDALEERCAGRGCAGRRFAGRRRRLPQCRL